MEAKAVSTKDIHDGMIRYGDMKLHQVVVLSLLSDIVCIVVFVFENLSSARARTFTQLVRMFAVSHAVDSH